MFLIIFSLALLIANIYFFIEKKYLYLFIPCMLFLPDYYGIDFSESLPVVTVTRIMFIVFYIYAIVNRKKNITVGKIHIKSLPKQYLLLFGYFSFRLLSNLYYVTTYSDAIKTIFEIIFEQLLLLIAIYMIDPSKEEIITLTKTVVWTAFAFFILGISESLFSIRPFDQLYTISRSMLNQHFIRLGLLRSTTTLGLPGFYGNMCLLMFPLITYLLFLTKQKRYMLVLLFDFLAMLHSGSRADLIFYFVMVIMYLIIVVRRYDNKADFLKRTLILIIGLVAIIGTLSIINPVYEYFYTGTVKSALNEIGFDFDLESGAPEGIGGFGENDDYGSGSRLAQFSGIAYTMTQNPMFGLGSKPLKREAVYYYSFDNWHVASAFDVGLVEVICSEGLLGLIAHIMLFAALLLIYFKRNNKTGLSFYQYGFLSVCTYLLCMLCTANMYHFLFLIIILNISLSDGHKTLIVN